MHLLITLAMVLSQALPEGQRPPEQIPQVDLVVEVIGSLPIAARLDDLQRRLGRRQQAVSVNRRYPPTILELITLVKRNPEKPRGRAWNSIEALTTRLDAETMQVTMEYCVDQCGHDPRTGAFHPRRRMVSYTASEQHVQQKLNQKLNDLKKYAER